eukprot:Skav231094  [mRNA]  locus=scaffold2525:54843:55568:+ [translate_table: standard]
MGAQQALVAMVGLFGLGSGQEPGGEMRCYSLQNPCRKDLYIAFGLPMTVGRWGMLGNEYTRGWWRIDAGHQKKYCFKRDSKLYAYFDWAGSDAGHYQSDVSFSIGQPREFCVSQKATHIYKSWYDETTTGVYYRDVLDGWSLNESHTCEGLGIGATMRSFELMDDGDYHSAATIRQCPTWQGSHAQVAPVEAIHQHPNSADLQHVINATNPIAVLGYHPQKGWSVEEPQDGQETTENALLP